MAVDAGLMERARQTGEAVLRVYAWARPTLSFGRHEGVRSRFDPVRLEAEGVAAVRRPTGGRVLLHDREVTYSVTAPSPDSAPLGDAYRAINALLRVAIERLGVIVTESPGVGGLRPGGAACFAEPAAGELVVGNRKLVGSAQVREGGALLQHGSILIADDQSRITALASAPLVPALPAATLTAALGRVPTHADVRDALFGALCAAVSGVDALSTESADAGAGPYRARFSDPEWTWRR
jgi:lipoate-protein ligase A